METLEVLRLVLCPCHSPSHVVDDLAELFGDVLEVGLVPLSGPVFWFD